MSDHLLVVTGGPGSGKTSLLTALAQRGFRTMPEAGRGIIQQQLAIGGQALPWGDRSAFAELMLSWELRSHGEAMALDGPVLLDRGVPDVLGYLALSGLPIPPHVERAALRYRYNRRVFIAPYWEDIFTQDAERKQDKREAEATFEAMALTYTRLGYDLLVLPKATIADRVQVVLSHLAS